MGTTLHRRLQDHLDAYVDGELNEVRREAVGAHLQSCPDCSAAAHLTIVIKTSLQRLRQPTLLAAARLERWARGLPRL